MKCEEWGAGEADMRAALELCERVYGKGSAESGVSWVLCCFYLWCWLHVLK